MKEYFKNLDVNNHYLNRYFKLIKHFKEINFDNEITESHHILPKSIFPQYKSPKEFIWNIVKIPYREHLILHLVLSKCFNGKQKSSMIFALRSMLGLPKNCKSRYVLKNSKYYNKLTNKYMKEYCRGKNHHSFGKKYRLGKKHSEETKKLISEIHKGKKVSLETTKKQQNTMIKKYGSKGLGGSLNGMHGKTFNHTQKAKNLISKAHIGKIVSDETKLKISKAAKLRTLEQNPFFGKKHSEESLRKISETKKNEIKLECPHCKKLASKGNSKRWHFDNCKTIR